MSNPVLSFIKKIEYSKKNPEELSASLFKCKKPYESECMLDYIKKKEVSPDIKLRAIETANNHKVKIIAHLN